MPSYTLDATNKFMDTVSDLEKRSGANSPGEVLGDAINVYSLLKRIAPVSQDGQQRILVKTDDGKEYNVILP